MENICLLNQNNENVNIADYRGKWVVIYFYPKDNTPGCTTEAKEFSHLKNEFDNIGAVIFGVSADSTASHKKFEEKQGLAIGLLSDPDKKIIESFGAYGEKNMYGKKVMGIIITTVLIDKEGREVFRWNKVKAAGHAEIVLAKIKELLK